MNKARFFGIRSLSDGQFDVTVTSICTEAEAQAIVDEMQSSGVATDFAFGAGASSAAPSSSDDGPATKKKRKRRTKAEMEAARAAEAEVEDEEEAEEEAPKPARSRRRRSAAKEEAADEGISDKELTTALSNAANIITPEVVMQILSEDFDTEEASEIPQDKRQEFLDALQYEIDGEGA